MSTTSIGRNFSPIKSPRYIQIITVPKADPNDQILNKPQLTTMRVLITLHEKPEEAEKDSSTPKIESYSLFPTVSEKDPGHINNTQLKKTPESRVLSNIINIMPTPSSITGEKNKHNQELEYFRSRTVKSVDESPIRRSRADTF